MRKFVVTILTVALFNVVSVLFAAEPLHIETQFANVSTERQDVLTQILRTRIAERSSAGELTVSFTIDSASLQEEEFILDIHERTAKITSGSFRGLIVGLGKLLRSISYHADSFEPAQFTLREKPDASFRCCYFARHFHNWYHMADAEELNRYVEDLALWGFNTIATIPAPIINLDLDPESKEWREAIDGVKQIFTAAKRLDMATVSMLCPNQATHDMPEELAATPNVDPKRGNNGHNACPSKPEGIEYLEKIHRALYGSFVDLPMDYTCLWPFDEGGCECEECSPWATNGYLKYSERLAKLINREFMPDQRFILSTWTYHEDEFETTWKWLEGRSEVPYVLADSHSDFPKYPLEHPLPQGCKMITFPEISMQGRFPWGGFGATPQPRRFSELWGQVRGHVDGCMLYSEGPYEDINKILEAGFYYDNADSDLILREYARYELCGCDPEDFVALCNDLETILVMRDPTPEYREVAARAMRLAMKIDAELLPSLKNCWRWRQCYCRCLLEYERNVRGNERTQTYADAIRELQVMYHSDRFPEGCVDEMHGWVTPSLPQGEPSVFPRPEEELRAETE